MILLDDGTLEEGREWVGREVADRRCEQPYGVTQGRLVCGLVNDANPIYWDDELAGHRFGGAVVPAATLMSWSLPLPWRPTSGPELRPLWALVPLPGDTIINVGTTTTYERPLRANEELRVAEAVLQLSEAKATRLGIGHFLTTRSTYRDARGATVAVHDNTLFRYRSGGSRALEAADAPPPPEPSRADVSFDVPVTRLLCALDVAATLDLFPGHHDERYARAQGVPDTYVNTMFFQALVDRAATDIAGPGTHPRSRELSMRRPAHVGEIITVRAYAAGGDAVEVDVRTDGGHVCAAATVAVGDVGPS